MSSLFDFDREPDEYAVMGNPVSHSQSPLIHSLFATQTTQRIHYSAIQVDPGGFSQAVGNFIANGGKGLNITVPFKQDAWALASDLSARAKLAGAVNTLKLTSKDEKDIFGDNTDGVGLVNDITANLNTEISNKRILLVGAGGAARGVIAPILDLKPAELVIANRSVDKAEELSAIFKSYGAVTATGFEALTRQSQFDIVINATSASLNGELPPVPADIIRHSQLCYDMMYGAKPTVFMQWCLEQGAPQVSDGLGMLVEQAAESFFIWRNVKPETTPVINLVREKLVSGE